MNAQTTQANALSNAASSHESSSTEEDYPDWFWDDQNIDINLIVEQAVLARAGKGVPKRIVELAAKARYFQLLEAGLEELQYKFTLDQFLTLLSLNPHLEWNLESEINIAKTLWIELGEPESHNGESGELLGALASLSLPAQYALVDAIERVWRMDKFATYNHAAEMAGLHLKETAEA